MEELFDGKRWRERTSFVREWEWLQRTIAAGDTFSNVIPFTQAAGMAIIPPAGMDGTYIALYGAHEKGGTPRAIRKSDDSVAVVTVRANEIISLPADIFPVGFIFLASASDSDGTLEVESAERTFMVMLKP